MFRRLDLSSRGSGRAWLWTILGALGCVAVAVLVDSLSFGPLTDREKLRSVLTDVFVTLLLAAPLLYFFSSKLRELAIAHHGLAIYASTDSLTKMLNRGAFTTPVDAYLNQVRDHERNVSGALLVIDVDHFKHINDSYGCSIQDTSPASGAFCTSHC